MQDRSTPRDRAGKDWADEIAALQRLVSQARESGISARSVESGLFVDHHIPAEQRTGTR